MSVLSKYFDKSVNQASPVQVDFHRVVNRDQDENEVITFVPVDYPTLQASLGVVSDWSLQSLLRAGVSPDSSIRTGLPTRLEGLDVVRDAVQFADSLVSSDESVNEQ